MRFKYNFIILLKYSYKHTMNFFPKSGIKIKFNFRKQILIIEGGAKVPNGVNIWKIY